ncbi:MAG: PKD domain-containing protein, partial [Nanoarchaeota archaeon]
SVLNNCVIQNSTVKNIVASNCNFTNSFVDPPSGTNDLTGSTIRNGSTTINSNVTFSTVDSSTITNSSVTTSTITGSTVLTSTISGSTITNSTIEGSTVTNSTITNSTLLNATVTDAVIVDNTLQSGTLTFNGTTYTGPYPVPLANITNFRPLASFTASATTINAGDTVQFTGTSTDANIPGPLNDSLTYSWDFGGQGTSTAQSPSFQFTSAGTFSVRLTVTDSFGQSNSNTQTVQVNTPSTTTPPTGGGGRNHNSGGTVTTVQPGTYTLDLGSSSSGLERQAVTGDVYNFKYNGEDYTVRIIKVGADFVTVQVNAQPERNIINGGTAKFNLDGDDTFDLAVMVKGIVFPKATLVLQLIDQKIPNTAVVPLTSTATPVTNVDTEPATQPTTETTPVSTPRSEPVPSTEPAKQPWKLTLPQFSPTAVGAGIVVAIVVFGLLMYGIGRRLVLGSSWQN